MRRLPDPAVAVREQVGHRFELSVDDGRLDDGRQVVPG